MYKHKKVDLIWGPEIPKTEQQILDMYTNYSSGTESLISWIWLDEMGEIGGETVLRKTW